MSSGSFVDTPADPHREGRPEIYSEQVRLLYENADAAAAVNLLVSAALSYLQWAVIPRSTLLLWLVYMAGVSLLRFALTRVYFRAANIGNSNLHWEVAFTIGTGLSGIGWGAAGVFLYPEAHLNNQVFLVFVLGGMMLGGSAILAARPAAILAFLIPTGFPAAARFLFEPDTPHRIMALLMLLFNAAILLTTFHFHRAVTRSLGLSFENNGLVSRLQAATQHLQTLNEGLETRVRQRTAELDETVLHLREEITERRRAEEQRAALEARLRHTQKLEALGVLSGGIAHEFNNLLTSIAGYTQVVRESLPSGAEAANNLEEVLKASDRAANLVRWLLIFGHKTEHKPRLISIGRVVSEALELVACSLPPGAILRQSIQSGCGNVFADPDLIHQIVVNLCANAKEALPGKGGVVEVSLAPAEVGGAAPPHPGLADGAYVQLTVRDTGRGIPPELAERIFDPFFTTKPVGGGTGLGLSVVHGIVATYGGRITFESEASRGTRFVVLLPRVDAAAQKAKTEAPEPEAVAPQRILLVDDEEAIARLGALLLRGLGHAVTSLTSSNEAIQLFLHQPESFDLVLTDLTMPQMTGKELIRRLRDIRPDIPAILMSGFQETPLEFEIEQTRSATDFLSKPFSRSDLANAIRSVLRKREQQAQ